MSALTAADALRLHGLHWLARLVLRVRPPLEAKALVERIASHLPALRGVQSARDAVVTLFPAGSCLTRAVTIAAALPGADVVIGVDVWNAAQVTAHAWLEIDGVRVDTRPGDAQLPDELTRLTSSASNGLLRSPKGPNL